MNLNENGYAMQAKGWLNSAGEQGIEIVKGRIDSFQFKIIISHTGKFYMMKFTPGHERFSWIWVVVPQTEWPPQVVRLVAMYKLGLNND